MGHEQKRPDRDEYVDVHWDKMWDPKDKIDWTDQYLKDPKADMSRPYDYNSLMQCMPDILQPPSIDGSVSKDLLFSRPFACLEHRPSEWPAVGGRGGAKGHRHRAPQRRLRRQRSFADLGHLPLPRLAARRRQGAAPLRRHAADRDDDRAGGRRLPVVRSGAAVGVVQLRDRVGRGDRPGRVRPGVRHLHAPRAADVAAAALAAAAAALAVSAAGAAASVVATAARAAATAAAARAAATVFAARAAASALVTTTLHPTVTVHTAAATPTTSTVPSASAAPTAVVAAAAAAAAVAAAAADLSAASAASDFVQRDLLVRDLRPTSSLPTSAPVAAAAATAVGAAARGRVRRRRRPLRAGLRQLHGAQVGVRDLRLCAARVPRHLRLLRRGVHGRRRRRDRPRPQGRQGRTWRRRRQRRQERARELRPDDARALQRARRGAGGVPTHVRRRWPRVPLGEGSVGAVPTAAAVCSADFTASLHAAASVVAAVAIAALASGHAAPTHAAATNVALKASTAATELAAAPLATFDGHVPSLVGHLLRRDQWHRRQRRRQRRRRGAELLHPLRRRVQLRDSHVRRATRRGDGRGGGAGAGAGAEPAAIA